MDEIEKMMKAIDLDRDGVVDLSDFLSGLTKFKDIMQEKGLLELAEQVSYDKSLLADPRMDKAVTNISSRAARLLNKVEKELDHIKKANLAKNETQQHGDAEDVVAEHIEEGEKQQKQ